MIRFLLWAYLLAHLLAFWRLRRAPFQIWRWYCLGACLQAAASPFGMSRDAWWGLWAYSEPAMLAWRALALAELFHFATLRLYPLEFVSLRRALWYIGGIGLVIVMGASASRGFISFRAAIQVGLAMSIGTGIWWFWRRPQAGMSSAVIRHAKLLAVYLAIKAGVALSYPAVRDTDPAYWIINGCYLAAVSLLMVSWSTIGAARYPAAYQRSAT